MRKALKISSRQPYLELILLLVLIFDEIVIDTC
jgi:hypothetical protein